MGKAFRGVYHLIDDKVQLFDPHGDKGTAAIVDGLGQSRAGPHPRQPCG